MRLEFLRFDAKARPCALLCQFVQNCDFAMRAMIAVFTVLCATMPVRADERVATCQTVGCFAGECFIVCGDCYFGHVTVATGLDSILYRGHVYRHCARKELNRSIRIVASPPKGAADLSEHLACRVVGDIEQYSCGDRLPF